MKKNLVFAIIALVGILVIGCTTGGNDVGKSGDVAATVNGVNISMEKFDALVNNIKSNYKQQGMDIEGEESEELLEQINQQAINNIIQEEVLKQTAEKEDYEAPQEELEAEFARVKEGFETEEEFQTALEMNGFTEKEFKTRLETDIKIRQFIDNQIEEVSISEEELHEIYEQYVESSKSNSDETEEAPKIPPFEEAKEQLESQVKQEKEQGQIQQIINKLTDESEIEIFI